MFSRTENVRGFKRVNVTAAVLLALTSVRHVFQLKHIPPYGFLYYKQLQSLFRQCGQVKSIVFDGAK